MIILEKILACPKCKTLLKVKNEKLYCLRCKIPYAKEDGIWQLLYLKDSQGRKSQKEYDMAHKKYFGGPDDGSYEILSAMARGNETVDIACGEGQIEKLSPETVAVEFSQNALIKAKKNGAKYLVLADAHSLPFADNSFDVSISAGNIEHFQNPQKAINEMARVSRIQVMTVHRHLPIPFGKFLFHLVTNIFNIKHQPLEKPISEGKLVKLVEKAGLHIVFKGVWTLPVNYGKVIPFLPVFEKIPSCYFVISVKR